MLQAKNALFGPVVPNSQLHHTGHQNTLLKLCLKREPCNVNSSDSFLYIISIITTLLATFPILSPFTFIENGFNILINHI